MTTHVRKPAGAPGSTGGQFDGRGNRNTAGTLPVSYTTERDSLLNDGYTTSENDTLTSIRKAAAYWSDAEQRHTTPAGHKDAYPLLTETGYPKGSYSGDEINIVMPKAELVKQYATHTVGKTFDIPLEYTFTDSDGELTAGYARITPMGPHNFDVKTVNVTETHSAAVAEAVAAILESRKPTVALKNIGPLNDARKARIASHGITMSPTFYPSTLVREAGYNKATGILTVNLAGRHYSYEIPEATYLELVTSPSPGRTYNQLVKNSSRKEHEQCGNCYRFHTAANHHQCPARPPFNAEVLSPFN